MNTVKYECSLDGLLEYVSNHSPFILASSRIGASQSKHEFLTFRFVYKSNFVVYKYLDISVCVRLCLCVLEQLRLSNQFMYLLV